ncbi:MAG: VOC family protein [Solirubrobacteraceae bacterium]
MGGRSEYKPGTFSWTDLTASDQAGAKSFYGSLFGWQAEDMPMGDGAFYSIMRQAGKDVAAIAPQQAEQRELGVPPTWNSYVTVESADAAAARAAELGATVILPPSDAMQAGRMAGIQDPQGAVFLVWEPRESIGAQLVNAHGALAWNELASADPEASREFYEQLFGWQTEQFAGSPQPYLTIKNEGSGNGGIRQVEAGVPPSWLVYFAIDDLDAGLALVTELGGQVHGEPIDIGIARIGIAADQQGAMFALYCGELEP